MAKPEKPAPAKPGKPVKPDTVEVAAKPNSKKLLLGIIGALVVIGITGGAVYYFTSKDGNHAKEFKAHAPSTPPKFIKLDTFTVNLHHEPGEEERVLQTAISLEIQDTEQDKLEEKVKLYMPKIYNNLLILLSKRSAAELTSTGDGKQQLAREIKAEVEYVLGLRTAPVSKPIVHAGSEQGTASGVIAAAGVIAASGVIAQPGAEATADAEATPPEAHTEAAPVEARARIVSVLFTSFIIQ